MPRHRRLKIADRSDRAKGADLHGSHPAQPQADSDDRYQILRGGGAMIVLEAAQGERPIMLYCGPDIPVGTAEEMALLATRQHAPGGPDIPPRGSLALELGTGISGPVGLIAQREGRDWAIDLRICDMVRSGAHSLEIICEDINTAIAATYRLTLDAQTGMLACTTSIENRGDSALTVDWCASLCLPLDPRLTQITGFTGRWAGEFQTEDIGLFSGSYVRENTSGRTSHASFPGLILSASGANETAGLAAAYHLAWSGNHRVRVDRHADGQNVVQMGELPLPGEIRLNCGETYQTPTLLACWSNAGTGTLSQCFHRYLTAHILDGRIAAKPRPVHFNTWEAIYFDHDPDTLIALAQQAAAVGAERFVLDDGWFGDRRSPDAGLGDWWVSKHVYTDGLTPLVQKVRELGMEFGLWFEPEMVNPDSDLYRAHPDWVLQAEGVEAVPFRGQLTLDLTKTEVFDYLFAAIDALVREYAIDYIKWDMNRDTHHPIRGRSSNGISCSDGPGSGGRAVMHGQTQAVYHLMAKLRSAHPALEIESCASGGGRADFGIMRHADRIWTSDNNDARERQAIQRGASHFFPLRVLGSHVGPKRCHITGRMHSMAYRVATAIFGHMGMELDLRQESADDIAILAAGIALYKQHRELIHLGNLVRLDTAAHINALGCIAEDQAEALFSYALTDSQPQSQPARLFLRGLDPGTHYRTRIIWPQNNPSISSPSIVDAAQLTGKGSVFSGAVLMDYGMQTPLIYPDNCLIYHLKAEH